MRRYVFRLTFLALAALGTSVVLGNDQQIAKTIVEKLSAEKEAGNLKGFSIDLKIETDGTVWLTGRVSSEEQRSLALAAFRPFATRAETSGRRRCRCRCRRC